MFVCFFSWTILVFNLILLPACFFNVVSCFVSFSYCNYINLRPEADEHLWENNRTITVAIKNQVLTDQSDCHPQNLSCCVLWDIDNSIHLFHTPFNPFNLSFNGATYFCKTCHRFPGWIRSDTGTCGSCVHFPADICPSNLPLFQTGPPHTRDFGLHRSENMSDDANVLANVARDERWCVPGGWRLWW